MNKYKVKLAKPKRLGYYGVYIDNEGKDYFIAMYRKKEIAIAVAEMLALYEQLDTSLDIAERKEENDE